MTKEKREQKKLRNLKEQTVHYSKKSTRQDWLDWSNEAILAQKNNNNIEPTESWKKKVGKKE